MARQKIAPALVISLLLHAGLFAWGVWETATPSASETRAAGKRGRVSVSLLSPHPNPPPQGGREKRISTPAQEREEKRISAPVQEGNEKKSPPPLAGGGKGEGETHPAENAGEGGASEILRQIRIKIQQAKYFPLAAKRLGLSGESAVGFRIRPDGTLASAAVTRSSGSDLLDATALKILRNALPLPYYPDPITLTIAFPPSQD